jgi:hypothetical protein
VEHVSAQKGTVASQNIGFWHVLATRQSFNCAIKC